jgi:hypothetical protein
VCPRRILLLLVPVLVCALYFPWRKTAGDDWSPIDPAEPKMTSEPKAPGAPAIYLYREFDRKENRSGQSTPRLIVCASRFLQKRVERTPTSRFPIGSPSEESMGARLALSIQGF